MSEEDLATVHGPQARRRDGRPAVSRDGRDVLAAGDVLSWLAASVHVLAGRA